MRKLKMALAAALVMVPAAVVFGTLMFAAMWLAAWLDATSL